MGKHGPCYHCGVTSTPLWRNGPPEKPILCNACGSRWRTKGTLANYTPLHARAEPNDLEDCRVSRMKNVSIKNKEGRGLKRKENFDYVEVGGVASDYNQGLYKNLDEDTSKRSSSGSAISNSESYPQFGSGDASESTGPSQPMVWDSTVPSKKRTCVIRPKPSPIEKLTKDLYAILHEQQSYFSGSSEEDLLFESDKPMVSVEIGHGSVLIQHPSLIAREEESEASSLSFENKQLPVGEAYSRSTTLSMHGNMKVGSLPTFGFDTMNKPSRLGLEQEKTNRDKDQLEKLQPLAHHNSPICHLNLNDILNCDIFESHLSNDDQQQLLKYLPPMDTSSQPNSLKSMFDSPQFKENLPWFQQLLAEGVFDNSLAGVNMEDCKTLRRLVLCNLTKSKWVQQYNLLKDAKRFSSSRGPEVDGGINVIDTGHSVVSKRSRDGQNHKFSGAKTMMKSPKKVMVKESYEQEESMDNSSSYFSPKRLFSIPSGYSSLGIDSSQFADENSEQDLLLDVPSSGSFHQAELLLPTSNFGAQASGSGSLAYSHLVRP